MRTANKSQEKKLYKISYLLIKFQIEIFNFLIKYKYLAKYIWQKSFQKNFQKNWNLQENFQKKNCKKIFKKIRKKMEICQASELFLQLGRF